MDYTKKSPTVLSLCTGYGGLERGIERVIGAVNVLAHVEEAKMKSKLTLAREARRCVRCNCLLRIDNSGPVCSPCDSVLMRMALFSDKEWRMLSCAYSGGTMREIGEMHNRKVGWVRGRIKDIMARIADSLMIRRR